VQCTRGKGVMLTASWPASGHAVTVFMMSERLRLSPQHQPCAVALDPYWNRQSDVGGDGPGVCHLLFMQQHLTA
jgi:hypothetical protein